MMQMKGVNLTKSREQKALRSWFLGVPGDTEGRMSQVTCVSNVLPVFNVEVEGSGMYRG